jgi:hypothetical protein
MFQAGPAALAYGVRGAGFGRDKAIAVVVIADVVIANRVIADMGTGAGLGRLGAAASPPASILRIRDIFGKYACWRHHRRRVAARGVRVPGRGHH